MRSQGYGFTFNGVTSAAMGVHMTALPSRPRAAMRGKAAQIPGRSGDLWQGDGAYEPFDIELGCRTRVDADMNAIAAWLTGMGDLILDGDPGYMYRARAALITSFDRWIPKCDMRNFKIKFTVQPFRYVVNPAPITLLSGGAVNNPGTVKSEPRITIYGNGDIIFVVGGQIIYLAGVSGSIILDSEPGMAYKMNGEIMEPQSHRVTGDWPELQPGYTMISWTGSVQRVDIEPRWRYL